MIGNTLGNYQIIQKIGQGGVGEVWKAVDLSLHREVALKILRPDLAARSDVVARFRSEALTLARLNHPNVATIHGFHTEGGVPFIVMEYIPGQTLHMIVRGFGPMQSERALPLFFQILDAVQHAHDSGIVHRDLKASNVMMNHLGVIKMLDLGLARVLGTAHLTQGLHSLGTPSWMAPEQIRGEEADVRTDVYALGLLLYWLLTARLPFEGDNAYLLQRAHLEESPPSPRSFTPGLSETIDKTILRSLAKERSERFPNVAELRRALGEGFVPQNTVPFLTYTIDESVAHTLTFADECRIETKRESAPAELRAQADTHAVAAAAECQTTASQATLPVLPSPPLPMPARPRRLRLAVATLALAVVVAAVVLTLSRREPPLPNPGADVVAENRAAIPEAVAQAPAPPPAAKAPDREQVPASRAPSQSHQPVPRKPSHGGNGWSIKRR